LHSTHWGRLCPIETPEGTPIGLRKNMALLCDVSCSEINENNIPVHSVSIAFLTTLEEGEIRGSEQAHEIEYFASLPEENLHPIQGKFLKEYWGKLMEM